MRYLFFDIECADGMFAICEFGYVICDENFKITHKRNILINPRSKFRLTNRKKSKDLALTYPIEEYIKHNEFNEFYDNIKFLLTQKNIKIFGYAVNNDISFLFRDTLRYNLKLFDFSCYDVQKMLNIFSSNNNASTSLEKAYTNLVKDKVDIKHHHALCDAYKSMLIFKAMVEALDTSVEQFISLCSSSFINALSSWNKTQKNEQNKRQKRKWDKFVSSYKNKIDNDKTIYVSDLIYLNDKQFEVITKYIKDNNLIPTKSISACYLVFLDEKEKNKRLIKIKEFIKGEILIYQDILNKMKSNNK